MTQALGVSQKIVSGAWDPIGELEFNFCFLLWLCPDIFSLLRKEDILLESKGKRFWISKRLWILKDIGSFKDIELLICKDCGTFKIIKILGMNKKLRFKAYYLCVCVSRWQGVNSTG